MSSKRYQVEQSGEKIQGVPVFGVAAKQGTESETGLSSEDYLVRVEKFVLSDDESACTQLESVLNRGLLSNASGVQEVIILDRQQSFFEGAFFVVLTYLERRVR